MARLIANWGLNCRLVAVKGGDYKEALTRIQSKLQDWKSQWLSMAGRITMVHSVLGPTVVYNMKNSRVPKSIFHEVERAQRQFIWGSTSNKRKMHHISQKTLCKPKDDGGWVLDPWSTIMMPFSSRFCGSSLQTQMLSGTTRKKRICSGFEYKPRGSLALQEKS